MCLRNWRWCAVLFVLHDPSACGGTGLPPRVPHTVYPHTARDLNRSPAKEALVLFQFSWGT